MAALLDEVVSIKIVHSTKATTIIVNDDAIGILPLKVIVPVTNGRNTTRHRPD